MRTINILAMQRTSAADRARIEGIDPAIKVTDAGGWFDGEIRDTWPAFATARYLGPKANGHGTREERDKLLAEAEVVLGGFPFILDMRSRAPKLKWFHQRPAGASNLIKGDLWGSDVVVTTSRGVGNTVQIAEYAVASLLHFAKGLHRAAVDRAAGAFGYRAYQPLLVQGENCVRIPSAPAASAWKWAGCVPRSACASSARGARRSRAPPCRPASASSAVPAISTGFCPRAISWPSAAIGRRRPPISSTRSASPP